MAWLTRVPIAFFLFQKIPDARTSVSMSVHAHTTGRKVFDVDIKSVMISCL